MSDAKKQFAFRVAEAIFKAERDTQRMMGADWVDTYNRAWAIYDEAYNFILDAQDRPSVNLEARIITGKGLPL